MTKPYEVHRRAARRSLSFHLVTVSTGRYAKMAKGRRYTDESGDTAERLIEGASHRVAERRLVSDDSKMIRAEVRDFLEGSADVLVFTGGTGVSPTDVTVESVAPFLEKELPGFGELLRSMSFRKIGTPALLTRATAGVAKGKLILCLPGSPDAVDTALRSFMPELPHVVSISRGR